MPDKKWKKIHMYKCPCGYGYEPEKGDQEAGWQPETPFENLPEALTCP